MGTRPQLDAEAAWRVLVDALDVWPDAELIERDDWVQLRTPSSRFPKQNQVLRARLEPQEVDERVTEVLDDHATRLAGLTWVVDVGSSPPDLSQRLEAAGIPRLATALAMAREVPEEPAPPLPPGVRIEPATADDAERLGDVGARAWGRGAAIGPAITEWVGRIFAGQAGDVRFWLAYLDDELVGSGTLQVLPGIGYLQGAAVIPEARRKGIYRALTWTRMAELRARGIPHVVIWAGATTSGPIARGLGFREIATAHYHELQMPADENDP